MSRRRHKYSSLDIQLEMLYDDLLDPRNDSDDIREIASNIETIQKLKEKELEIEDKRRDCGKSVETDTIVNLIGKAAMFGGFMWFEKQNPVTLKNSLRFLSLDKRS